MKLIKGKINMNQLNKQLSEFGLNPVDWCLKCKSKKTEFDIIYKHDNSFRFKGILKSKSKESWDRIELISI